MTSVEIEWTGGHGPISNVSVENYLISCWKCLRWNLIFAEPPPSIKTQTFDGLRPGRKWNSILVLAPLRWFSRANYILKRIAYGLRNTYNFNTDKTAVLNHQKSKGIDTIVRTEKQSYNTSRLVRKRSDCQTLDTNRTNSRNWRKMGSASLHIRSSCK